MASKPIKAFVIFAFFGVPLLLIAWGVRDILRSRETYGWATTKGTVSEARIVKEVGGKTVYWPFIRYSFLADERSYSSTSVATSRHLSGAASEAELLIKRFPAGASIDVHYDPTDPSRSVLIRYHAGVLSPLFGGLGIIVLVLFCSRRTP